MRGEPSGNACEYPRDEWKVVTRFLNAFSFSHFDVNRRQKKNYIYLGFRLILLNIFQNNRLEGFYCSVCLVGAY